MHHFLQKKMPELSLLNFSRSSVYLLDYRLQIMIHVMPMNALEQIFLETTV